MLHQLYNQWLSLRQPDRITGIYYKEAYYFFREDAQATSHFLVMRKDNELAYTSVGDHWRDRQDLEQAVRKPVVYREPITQPMVFRYTPAWSSAQISLFELLEA